MNFLTYKLILTHKLYGTKHIFYRSETEYLDYDPTAFEVEWQDKVQILPRGSDNPSNGFSQESLLSPMSKWVLFMWTTYMKHSLSNLLKDYLRSVKIASWKDLVDFAVENGYRQSN